MGTPGLCVRAAKTVLCVEQHACLSDIVLHRHERAHVINLRRTNHTIAVVLATMDVEAGQLQASEQSTHTHTHTQMPEHAPKFNTSSRATVYPLTTPDTLIIISRSTSRCTAGLQQEHQTLLPYK